MLKFQRRYVLNQILSGEATEIVVENVHEYLTNIGESIRKGEVNQDNFIIFKVSATRDALMTLF